MINIYEAILSDPTYFKTLSVKDTLIVNYNCPQMETWANLYTNLNHIIYTIKGERRIVRPEISIDARKGSLIFLRKGAFQQGRFHDEDWQVIVFAIHDVYFKNFIKEFRHQLKPQPPAATSKQETIFTINTDEITETFFHGLLPYFIQQTPPNESLLELKLRELIFNIFFNKANAGLLSYLDNLVNDRKSAFIDIMESNYMFNLSLADFAKLTYHSLTTFKTEFIEIFMTSPGKWLLQKRLDLSCRMMHNMDKRINEIALESGFESVTHFNRVFKERYNKTPSDYRRQISAMT
ncbi:MAG: AraC family transcriptional regulator [Cyclobacteriaceae bacterium]|nr:AraC family transcriptional regulator [Cyclobacteriaceae bacterium]